MRNRMLWSVLLAVGLVIAAGIGFMYSGWYNMSADTPHTQLVYRLVAILREQSVARHSKGVDVPDLGNPTLIQSGAGNYDAMCVGCHLAPDREDSELNRGLYPSPPRLDLPERRRTAATDFWIIKHGIKASGMPAWGKSMEDRYIWGMVAFLNQLPGLSGDQYRALVAKSGGHQHGDRQTVTTSGARPATEAGHDHHDDHSASHLH